MKRNVLWVEAWIDSSDGEYVLLVRGVENRIEIVDPHKGDAVIESFQSYDDALHWLNEDEYDQIEGRYVFER